MATNAADLRRGQKHHPRTFAGEPFEHGGLIAQIDLAPSDRLQFDIFLREPAHQRRSDHPSMPGDEDRFAFQLNGVLAIGGLPPGDIKIARHHLLDELGEGRFRLPAELLARLAGVADQLVDLRGAECCGATIRCQTLPGSTCSGRLKLTARVTRVKRTRHGRRRSTKTITLATRSIKLPAGDRAVPTVRLGKATRKLVRKYHIKRATLTLTQTVGGVTKTTRSSVPVKL